jgi:hypothetical protein
MRSRATSPKRLRSTTARPDREALRLPTSQRQGAWTTRFVPPFLRCRVAHGERTNDLGELGQSPDGSARLLVLMRVATTSSASDLATSGKRKRRGPELNKLFPALQGRARKRPPPRRVRFGVRYHSLAWAPSPCSDCRAGRRFVDFDGSGFAVRSGITNLAWAVAGCSRSACGTRPNAW